MPIAPLTAHAWTCVPPLDLPLALRLENGRFGALRPKRRHDETGAVQVINQIHEAVDLAATAGDDVFAAYSGRVAEVESNPAAERGNVTIDHHPAGLGFVTKYNHVTDITVAQGEFIQKGAPFAVVSSEPAEPHLHFEQWAVLDRASASGGPPWPGDGDLVPVDPTRMLYAWEVRTVPDEPLATAPLAPQSVGLVRVHAVPFFAATFATDAPSTVHVPLYEPVGTDERLTVDLLRDAHARNVDVVVHRRASAFWGLDVVTQVELA